MRFGVSGMRGIRAGKDRVGSDGVWREPSLAGTGLAGAESREGGWRNRPACVGGMGGGGERWRWGIYGRGAETGLGLGRARRSVPRCATRPTASPVP